MNESQFPVFVFSLDEADGGGFIGVAPDLPGCMSDGATREEAFFNVQLAIGEWIDEAQAQGRDIPAPNSALEQSERARKKTTELIDAQRELIEALEAQVNDLSSQGDLMESLQRASLSGPFVAMNPRMAAPCH